MSQKILECSFCNEETIHEEKKESLLVTLLTLLILLIFGFWFGGNIGFYLVFGIWFVVAYIKFFFVSEKWKCNKCGLEAKQGKRKAREL